MCIYRGKPSNSHFLMSSNDAETILHSTLTALLGNLTNVETQLKKYSDFLETQSAHRAHAAEIGKALKSGRDATQLIDNGIEPSIIGSQKP